MGLLYDIFTGKKEERRLTDVNQTKQVNTGKGGRLYQTYLTDIERPKTEPEKPKKKMIFGGMEFATGEGIDDGTYDVRPFVSTAREPADVSKPLGLLLQSMETAERAIRTTIASTPQALGGLMKEVGETAEIEPEPIDWTRLLFKPFGLLEINKITDYVRSQIAKKTEIDERIGEAGKNMIANSKAMIAAHPEKYGLPPDADKVQGFVYDLSTCSLDETTTRYVGTPAMK